MSESPRIRRTLNLSSSGKKYSEPKLSKKESFFSRVKSDSPSMSPRKGKEEEHSFSVRICNGLLEDYVKPRRISRGNSMGGLRSPSLISSKSTAELERGTSFMKVTARIFPQPAPRGYPARWSRVTFVPYASSAGDEKIEDLPIRFGVGLALFKSTSSYHLSSISAIIPLDDVLLERLGDCHFIIKQPYVIRDDAHDFQFRTGTPGQCESLLSLLSGWSNMSPPPAIEFFPTISPFNYYSIEGVRKASALSSQAEFQQVQVDLSTDSRSGDEVDEQVDTRWDMVSGTVNDILEWTVLQCNQGPDNDSIFVYSTLLFFHLSTHYSFSDSFSSHWKSRKLPSSAKAMGVALNINWDQMLRTLGEQVARSYVLLTQKERERFVKICKKHLSKSSCTVMKKSLENYQQKEQKATVLSLHQNVSLHPVWYPDESTVSILKTSSQQFAQQITLLEAQHHQQISIADLLSPTSSLSESSGLKLATSWWNKISFWVAGEILKEPTPKGQLQMVKKFVKIARKLEEMRNYSSCAQIVCGINHNVIQRLKRLQEIIPPHYETAIAELVSKFAHTDNYQKYRSLPHTSPFLPFLAVFQRDIIYIMDCNPMYKDDAKKIINVERLYMLAEVLCKTGSLHPEYHFNYPFERDVNITSYILENGRFEEEELWELSEKRECMATKSILHEEVATGEGEHRVVLNELFRNERAKEILRDSFERRARGDSISPAVSQS